MSKGMVRCLGWGMLGLGLVSSMARAQVVDIERDTKVTGPKGKTIERDINIQRGPGYINRQVEIKRPGETIIRDTRIQNVPGGGFGGPRGFGPPVYGGPRFYGGPRIVENVFVPRPAVVTGFVGLPAFSFFFGGGGGGPAPAPVVAPPPGPAPAPVFDEFTDAIGRLKSFHGNSRRDGCLTLGRLGDPRAVPALNERLEHDFDKEVRVSAAWALGEIGDERGAVALERAALHDHKHEVKEAAGLALKKLPRPGQPTAHKQLPASVPSPSTQPPPLPPGAVVSEPEVLDPGPTPSATTSRPIAPEDRPPPPPLPATGPVLEPPTNSAPARSPY